MILDDLTSQMHLDTKNRLVRLGKRTIERYLSQYQKFGLAGLKPKVRKEQGSLKAFPSEALAEAHENSSFQIKILSIIRSSLRKSNTVFHLLYILKIYAN